MGCKSAQVSEISNIKLQGFVTRFSSKCLNLGVLCSLSMIRVFWSPDRAMARQRRREHNAPGKLIICSGGLWPQILEARANSLSDFPGGLRTPWPPGPQAPRELINSFSGGASGPQAPRAPGELMCLCFGVPLAPRPPTNSSKPQAAGEFIKHN